MKSTLRLEIAINKLYAAFNENTLNPECCINCAVGNLLDNKDFWKHLSDFHGSDQLNYVGKVNQMMGRKFNGYTPLELLNLEKEFLKGCGYDLPLRKNDSKARPKTSKKNLFNGLINAIEYLCELDGVESYVNLTSYIDFSIQKNVDQCNAQKLVSI